LQTKSRNGDCLKTPKNTHKRRKIKMAGHFANARVEKIIRNAGARRVSADATNRLNEILTDYGRGIAKYAIEICRHNGRKTVKEDDIKLASQK
jgi:histone H3/H4